MLRPRRMGRIGQRLNNDCAHRVKELSMQMVIFLLVFILARLVSPLMRKLGHIPVESVQIYPIGMILCMETVFGLR